MSSPFAAILQRTDRTLVIAENEHWIAVLERKPLALGHVLVISKREEDHLFDLSGNELSSMMTLSKVIAHVIQKEITCRKVGMAAIGLETRHAHLHLVPISSADDLNFTRMKLQPDEKTLLEIAARFKNALGGLI